MPTTAVSGTVAVIHELGSLILIGSLFLVLVVLLPAVERIRSPRQRLQLRCRLYGRLFLWSWVGLLMLWGAGIGELLLAGEAGMPAHSVLVALLSLLFMALFLIAQFGLHLKALLVLENGNSEHARYLIYRLRPFLFTALLIAIVVAVLHVSGPALVPADLMDGVLGRDRPFG